METSAEYNVKSVCLMCQGARFIPRMPDLQDRNDEEPCWLCNPKPVTFSEMADQYDALVAKGYSKAQASQWMDAELVEQGHLARPEEEGHDEQF